MTDEWIKRMGYKDWNDYQNHYRYRNGTRKELSKNKECASYLGTYISERLLAKIWNNEKVIRMPNGNRGYDFICGRGFKVDVKSSCFHNSELKDNWHFNINKNKITDYFLFLVFDKREDLNPLHIWLIKGDEIINTGKLNDKMGFMIYNNVDTLNKLRKYEQTDKLEKLILCCDKLK